MNTANVIAPQVQNHQQANGSKGGKSIIGRRKRVAFYYLYTAFTLGAATALLIPQSQAGRGSNLIFSIAWVVMHAISIFIFLGFRSHRASHLSIAAVIGTYVIASTAWSASPLDTLVYGSMVAGNITTAYMISRDLDLREIMVMSARVILGLAILGTIAGLLGYSQALYYESAGRRTIINTHPIRGFFNHKVPAALYATLGALACLSCYRGLKRALAISSLGIFVVLTGSSTGLTIFPTALVLFWSLNRIRAFKKESTAKIVTMTGVAAGGLVIVILSMFMDAILSGLGRDPTLTGRTLLWDWGIKTWMQRPLVGWGFNGYFNSPYAIEISNEIKRFQNYDVPHFHQSYIQTAADLGILGLLILVGTQFSIISRSWKRMRMLNSEIAVSIIAMMIMMVISSMTMFIFITYNHYATLIMFALFFALRRPAPTESISSI